MNKMNEIRILDAVELFERDRSASPELAAELQRFAETADPTDPLVGNAIWALGKRFDPELKAFFISMLERTYRVNPHAGYQCLAVLGISDEDVLPGGGSVLEVDRNTQLAENYLKRIGRHNKSMQATPNGAPDG